MLWIAARFLEALVVEYAPVRYRAVLLLVKVTMGGGVPAFYPYVAVAVSGEGACPDVAWRNVAVIFDAETTVV